MFEILSIERYGGRLFRANICLQVDIDVEKETPVFDTEGELSYCRQRLTASAGTTYVIVDTRMERRAVGEILTVDQMDAYAAFEQAWAPFSESAAGGMEEIEVQPQA